MDNGVGKEYASQNVIHFISHMFVGFKNKRGQICLDRLEMKDQSLV